jgi:hypothetical protein
MPLDFLLDPGPLVGAPKVVEWLALGMGLFLAVFLKQVAKLFRLRPAPQVAEIAGAVIDKRDAEAIVDAVKANTAALKGLLREIANLAVRLEQNSEATKASAAEMAEVRDDMRALTREVINLAAKR